MRILVTGGSGFIGSPLCQRLLTEGQEVIRLDNIADGRRINITYILDNHRFELPTHDMTDPTLLEVG